MITKEDINKCKEALLNQDVPASPIYLHLGKYRVKLGNEWLTWLMLNEFNYMTDKQRGLI